MATFDLRMPTWARFFLRGGLSNPDRGPQYSGPQPGPSATGTVVTDERAIQISAVFSAIRLISEACASLPLTVYERRADGARVEARDHWLAKLLRQPNDSMTARDFRLSVYTQLAAWGNAYVEKVPNSRGEPVELWPLKPEAMTPIRDGYEPLTYKYATAKPVTFTQKQILHAKGFSTEGFVGLSPLGMARQALGLAVASEEFAAAYYANGGKPSGVLMVDKPTLTKDQSKQLEEKYGSMAKGSEHRGNGLWVLPSFAKYQQITIPPEDAQMLQTRAFQIAEIARIFRVPLFLLMEMEKSTSWGTGLEQQDLAFLKYSIKPYLDAVEAAMNRWLLSDKERESFYVEHNVEGFLHTDSQAKALFLSQMVNNGLMTRNEGRAKLNLPPDKDGDALTVQTALTPLGKLGQQTPADAGVSVSGGDE